MQQLGNNEANLEKLLQETRDQAVAARLHGAVTKALQKTKLKLQKYQSKLSKKETQLTDVADMLKGMKQGNKDLVEENETLTGQKQALTEKLEKLSRKTTESKDSKAVLEKEMQEAHEAVAIATGLAENAAAQTDPKMRELMSEHKQQAAEVRAAIVEKAQQQKHGKALKRWPRQLDDLKEHCKANLARASVGRVTNLKTQMKTEHQQPVLLNWKNESNSLSRQIEGLPRQIAGVQAEEPKQ